MANENERLPLFLINGFLEAGKTNFLQFTLGQDYFQTKGLTLLLVCEEGEEEYDTSLLEKTNTKMIVVENEEDMTPQYLKQLEKLYEPERVLMEWNGMWNIEELHLPEGWELYQQISIIDGSTFDLYLNNNDLKSLVGRMVRNTELLIMNRCDGLEEKLPEYQRVLKGMNTMVDIVFENRNGEVRNPVEEALPYDVEAEVIEIRPEYYGIWYIDAFEHRERYEGKMVEFTGEVLKRPEFEANDFVPGRMAMTCCEADVSFLGFMCKAKGGRKLQNHDWVKVRAKVTYEPRPEFGMQDGPMLFADRVESAEPIREMVTF